MARELRNLFGFVFRNLHHKGVVWSVRNKEGITIVHSNSVLIRNAKFVVQPAGRDKVRLNKKKTVHAGVKGEMVVDPVESSYVIAKFDQKKTAYYNPYTVDTFVDIDGKPLLHADYVLLTSDGTKSKVIYMTL